ncbi:hypothetical protein E0H75_20070 [Kribbella capetownensis]|uniref:Uncharacterized protein n=1 Tax=Kribbella capetownensis TaxID=1572659 RepID=A0A4R0JUM5_9ACTN|nr:hypothetical protein [Kribbella capetownensis]TCC48868.1 hypothetical protein E0H75_20070 [Kribbella capetownensis]
MSQTFEELLAELRPDADAVEQATRYYVAEKTGDLDPARMIEEMRQAAGDRGPELDAALTMVEQDSAQIESACLTVLAGAWEDPAERDAVRGALQDAKAQLPVIEVALIAITVAYGMYLRKTGGVKRQLKAKRHNPDGSIDEVEEIEYQSPDAPLRAITKLFSGGQSSDTGDQR